MANLRPRFLQSLLVSALLISTTPALALQTIDARDGVSVEASIALKEATRIKVDGANKQAGPRLETGIKMAEPEHAQRQQHRQQHRPDGERQLEPASRDPAKQGGSGDHQTEELKRSHLSPV